MCNYKALGIEKEIKLEFDSFKKSDLERLQNSCYMKDPYITTRNKEASYCTVMIVDCQYSNWWYADLIGLCFFCEIYWGKYPDGSRYIRELTCVRITTKKRIITKTINPKDALIV